jgi:hypothetical protein
MFRRGRPFGCRECGRQIVVPKASGVLAIAAFALLSFLSGRVPGLVIVAIMLAAPLLEWLLSPVRLAQTHAPAAG